jgi:ATP-dependent RNA helicase DHX57
MEEDPLLSGVTHVVVDEVHERSEESDFILMVLRDIQAARPDATPLRVICMSATLNSDQVTHTHSSLFGKLCIVQLFSVK